MHVHALFGRVRARRSSLVRAGGWRIGIEVRSQNPNFGRFCTQSLGGFLYFGGSGSPNKGTFRTHEGLDLLLDERLKQCQFDTEWSVRWRTVLESSS